MDLLVHGPRRHRPSRSVRQHHEPKIHRPCNGTASVPDYLPQSPFPPGRPTQSQRRRIRMRNESDHLHAFHLYGHSFKRTNVAGIATARVMKDIVILGIPGNVCVATRDSRHFTDCTLSDCRREHWSRQWPNRPQSCCVEAGCRNVTPQVAQRSNWMSRYAAT